MQEDFESLPVKDPIKRYQTESRPNHHWLHHVIYRCHNDVDHVAVSAGR